jgi:hypothetical protein
MKARRSAPLCLILSAILGLLSTPLRLPVWGWEGNPDEHPINVFTWHGGGMQWGTWDFNQKKLCTNPKEDKIDLDYITTKSSLPKLRNNDIVYILNHGGEVRTTWGESYYLRKHPDDPNRKLLDPLPTSDDEGPSLVVNWGCNNGDSDYVNAKGEHLNLLSDYARTLGILPDSKTKAYLAPKGKPYIDSSVFQSAFFEEFGKGDVTVEEAARRAWRKRKQFFDPGKEPTGSYTDDISILGNKDLTLKEIRSNLYHRERKPKGGSPTCQQFGEVRYCTNNPNQKAKMPSPPEAAKQDVPKTSAKESQAIAKKLLDELKSKGVNSAPLEQFQTALLDAVRKVNSPADLPPFLQPAGVSPPQPHDPTSLRLWKEAAEAAATAWWVGVLSASLRNSSSSTITQSLKNMFQSYRPRLKQLGSNVADAAARIADLR